MQVQIKIDIGSLENAVKKLQQSLAPPDRLLTQVGKKLLEVNAKRHARAVAPSGKPWAKLKPSTLAMKKTSFPLREGGEMLDFHLQVQGNILHIGTNIQRALFHHEGTKPYTIQPKHKKALAFGRKVGQSGRVVKGSKNAVGKQHVVKSVNHPGLPSRKIIGFEASDKLATENAINDYLKSVLSRIKSQ